MKFGITLAHYDYSYDQNAPIAFKQVSKTLEIASKSGFDIAYISDHPTLDIAKYGGDDTPYRSFDPLALAAALASMNIDIELGTLVLCEALRHPVNSAVSAQTIADVAGRQFTLGLGAGWHNPDYQIYGHEMPAIGERMTRLSESLQIIGPMLNGEVSNFDGKYYSSKNAMLTTPGNAISNKVKLIVGGKGDRLLSIVARYADGWNTCWAWTPEAYQDRLNSLSFSCEKYDRDPASVYKSLGLYGLVAQSENDLKDMFNKIAELSPKGVADGKTLENWRDAHLVGTVEEVSEQIANWAKLGVDEIVINPGFAPFHIGSDEIIGEIGASLAKAKEMADI